MAYDIRPTYLWRLFSVGSRGIVRFSFFKRGTQSRGGHRLKIKPIARCIFDAVDRRSLPCVDMADTACTCRRLATEDGVITVEIISATED